MGTALSQYSAVPDTSHLSVRSVDEPDVIKSYETYAFFRRWLIDDVRCALTLLPGMCAELEYARQGDSGDVYRVRCSWSEYQAATDGAEAHRVSLAEAVRSWSHHPAAAPYVFEKDEVEAEKMRKFQDFNAGRLSREHEEVLNDAYTTDEESEDESEESESEGDEGENKDENDVDSGIRESGHSVLDKSEEISKFVTRESAPSLPKSFDAMQISPVFFGYACSRRENMIKFVAEAREREQKEEREALARKIMVMESHAAEIEDAASSRMAKREEKIQRLEKAHCEAREQRRVDQDRVMNMDDLSPQGKKEIIEQLCGDANAAEIAAEAELSGFRTASRERNLSDAREVQDIKNTVRRLRDMDSDRVPVGGMMVSTLRKDLCKCTAQLGHETELLDDAQTKLDSLREELRASLIKRMRSVHIFAETRVEEAERRVQRALTTVDDHERLLLRALRKKKREDEVLPLFRPSFQAWSDPIEIKGSRDIGDELEPSACSFDVICAMTMACGDNLINKLSFLVSLFDANGDEFLCENEMAKFVHQLSKSLHYVGILQSTFERDEVCSIVLRAFHETGADAMKGMTCFEVRQWARRAVSQNALLSAFFCVKYDRGQWSTAQLLITDPVRQYEMGLLNASDLKYHCFWSRVIYRPCLDPSRKSVVHRLAMAMGADDYTKQDYSKFLPRKRRVASSACGRVIPLDHGHLANLTFCQGEIQCHAALKLQNIFRGRRSRMRAEELARREAFFAAREEAIQGMKDKVRAEFQRKESAVGPTKMKWDASIRMKQAKLQASGKDFSREEVVQYLVEQAEVAGHNEVVARFQELALERGFTDNEGEEGDYDNLAGTNDGKDEALFTEEYLMGNAPPDIIKCNITTEWIDPRDPNPSHKALIAFLRGLDDSVTLLKARNILLELPSLSLLFRYVGTWSRDRDSLLGDLEEHFIIPEKCTLATGMKLIEAARSNLKFGVMDDFHQKLLVKPDIALSHISRQHWVKGIDEAKERADGFDAEKVNTLCSRDRTELQKRQDTLKQEWATLVEASGRTKEAQRAVDEKQWNYDCALESRNRLSGEQSTVPILPSLREDWNERLYEAYRLPEGDDNEIGLKYEEIHRIYTEFCTVASKCAGQIIDELYVFINKKTVSPVAVGEADGRAKEGGRGLDGYRYKYEIHGIRFKVLLDDHGIFDGHDEFAAKAGGHELRASREYLRCALGGLENRLSGECNGTGEGQKVVAGHPFNVIIPMQATIDLHGFRVLAVAKIPIANAQMVLGTADRGKTILNRDRAVDEKMALYAKTLNISRHMVKGENDITARVMHNSVDIRGFKSGRDCCYLLNFWRAFPAENPSVTCNLSQSPR